MESARSPARAGGAYPNRTSRLTPFHGGGTRAQGWGCIFGRGYGAGRGRHQLLTDQARLSQVMRAWRQATARTPGKRWRGRWTRRRGR
ncbi:hypothetical protein KCP70_11255 [Salmonella enterica subsp. enterica]|nr:hypothetical protein KCP70_11255 [Salmonella enterica subsp. enterica]